MEINMTKVNAFLQDGFETVEALAVVDVLRRAGMNVETISLMDGLEVKSAQDIIVKADKEFAGYDFADTDVFFLPGGPGTKNYETKPEFINVIANAYKEGRLITAICAAPSVLGKMGLLKGRRATCFPGFENALEGAQVTGGRVETDGNVITSRGMGTSIDLGLEIIKVIEGEEKSQSIAKSTQYLD